MKAFDQRVHPASVFHAYLFQRRCVARAVLLALAASSGCGGHKSSEPPEPVAECVQYEQAVARCFHREVPFANKPAVLPKSEAERAQIKVLCTQNLHRLLVACR
jgi:hypothetical protein